MLPPELSVCGSGELSYREYKADGSLFQQHRLAILVLIVSFKTRESGIGQCSCGCMESISSGALEINLESLDLFGVHPPQPVKRLIIS
mgnify:CR=1 FL=1